jgi:hypothetical protein
MSNRIKMKKNKTKVNDEDKTKEIKEPKHGSKFASNKREKGTNPSNFSGGSSKEFARKKT